MSLISIVPAAGLLVVTALGSTTGLGSGFVSAGFVIAANGGSPARAIVVTKKGANSTTNAW